VFEPLCIPDDLAGAHEFVLATQAALEGEHGRWYDGRVRPWPEAGIFYVRVAPEHIDFTLRALQGLVEASERRGLVVEPLPRDRFHRPGLGIGSRKNLAAVEVEELRKLALGNPQDVTQWRWINDHDLTDEESAPIQQEIPTGNGKLRLRLPRRHDWPHRLGPGWRKSFTAEVGDPFRELLGEVLDSLAARAKAGA
jgi:hypothetical protein